MYNQNTKSFDFDEKKALEAILFIAEKVSDKYKVLKILYLAEKLCLEKYGVLICGDRYARLPYGVTPSNSLDLLEKLQKEENSELALNQNNISLKRKFDEKYLSKIDIECLEQSIEENKDLTFEELKRKTHDDDPTFNASNTEHFISIEHLVLGTKKPNEILKNLETIYE
jgi:hypothetical protein